jgi:adenylosuccinate synthase
MTTATVIIGANLGDEGKGLLTDCHAAAMPGALVVRFNGGAQAGHTVATRDGRRHVFSHFGSGSFAGAATYLSRFFVSHPTLFLRERAQLARLGLAPEVHIDPRSPITTPYDMLINQAIEAARASGRHGSCGIGFGETIHRCLKPRFATYAGDLLTRSWAVWLSAVLDDIRTQHVPARLKALGIAALDPERAALLASDVLIERFIADCAVFRDAVAIADLAALAPGRAVIFEGAQGLLLDQDRGWFPHVTRSNTGLKNAIALARDAGIDALDAVYATRAYMTRHGAGPLPHEIAALPYPRVRDETNLPNAHQGTLRFAWLDLDLLAQTIAWDLADARTAGLPTRHRLAITCLDQVDGAARFVSRGTLQRASVEELVVAAARAVGTDRALTSHGPTREDVAEVCVPAAPCAAAA